MAEDKEPPLKGKGKLHISATRKDYRTNTIYHGGDQLTRRTWQPPTDRTTAVLVVRRFMPLFYIPCCSAPSNGSTLHLTTCNPPGVESTRPNPWKYPAIRILLATSIRSRIGRKSSRRRKLSTRNETVKQRCSSDLPSLEKLLIWFCSELRRPELARFLQFSRYPFRTPSPP